MKNPYLYILMRTDMQSMNPGKAVAQGAHAANQFGAAIDQLTKTVNGDSQFAQDNIFLYNAWAIAGGGTFGTTITLGVDGKQLIEKVNAAKSMNFLAGVTHDPTYPLRDGMTTHLIPVDTCGFIFGDKDALKLLVGDLNLMY